jgi:hypothetical protein
MDHFLKGNSVLRCVCLETISSPYSILYPTIYFKLYSANNIKKSHLQFQVLYFTLSTGVSLTNLYLEN